MSSNKAADQIELLVIANRLGWLDTLRALLHEVRKQATEARQAKLNGVADDFTHIAGNLEIAEHYADNILHNTARKAARSPFAKGSADL